MATAGRLPSAIRSGELPSSAGPDGVSPCSTFVVEHMGIILSIPLIGTKENLGRMDYFISRAIWLCASLQFGTFKSIQVEVLAFFSESFQLSCEQITPFVIEPNFKLALLGKVQGDARCHGLVPSNETVRAHRLWHHWFASTRLTKKLFSFRCDRSVGKNPRPDCDSVGTARMRSSSCGKEILRRSSKGAFQSENAADETGRLPVGLELAVASGRLHHCFVNVELRSTGMLACDEEKLDA